MRNFRIGNVGLVGCVEQDQCVVLPRVIDPARKLFARRHRAGGIVWKTKINKIDMFLRRFGDKFVFRVARQINDSFVASVFARRAGVTGHHVRVDVNRVNRIGDRDFVLIAKNIENKTAIAFRSVRDKNLLVCDVDLAIAKILLRDCRS